MRPGLLLRRVEHDGELVDVRIRNGRIAAIGTGFANDGDEVIDGEGGAVLPGLHDHHLHLLAMAAADRSISLRGADLDDTLRTSGAAAPAGWVRAVGYDDAAHGALDRGRLDALIADRPVRVQHRSGAMWVLNSTALAVLPPLPDAPGVERDGRGVITGRLFGLDGWLREHLPPGEPPDLAAVGHRLAGYGVTGTTDTTATDRLEDLELLAAAVRDGLAVGVTVTGSVRLADVTFPAEVERGPVKIVVTDERLPRLDELSDWFERSHAADRNVAVHCVTRVALVLALAAWGAAGVRDGDRIEHGGIVPPELADDVADHGLIVVTQPGFIAANGDRYLATVDEVDRPHLYPCGSLLERGVPVGGSTDAPFGPEDPWVAMRTAVSRRTDGGRVVGEGERIAAERAVGLFLTGPGDPGGTVRVVEPGVTADLCLLDCPRPEALADLHHEHVAHTIRRGQITYRRS